MIIGAVDGSSFCDDNGWDRAADIVRCTCTPDPPQKWVHQEYAGPPAAPEDRQADVVGTVLRLGEGASGNNTCMADVKHRDGKAINSTVCTQDYMP